ncbi:MAG: hypothetical protein IPO83_10000 [Chitinophagaceae bacterium]|nr:hypothetical protein [Chitinophagaceae bacterium]
MKYFEVIITPAPGQDALIIHRNRKEPDHYAAEKGSEIALSRPIEWCD